MGGQEQSSDTIKIGVLADLDGPQGSGVWRSAVLAAEQINTEGGILGKQVEVIGEDSDSESGADINVINSALTRLLTYHKVDYVIGSALGEFGFMFQDTTATHETIYITIAGNLDELTQRVEDDYDKYKYYFRYQPANNTQIFTALVDELLHAREIMDFNKVGYIAEDHVWTKSTIEQFDQLLAEVYGFDLVYKGTFPPFDTFDFSSYFAAAESSGVEILIPLIYFDNGVAFIKEYYDRQSPMIVYGGIINAAGSGESWEQTDGKCEYIATLVHIISAGYPLTSETLAFRDSYIDRWGKTPLFLGAAAFDIIRFVLPDALGRAGTTETEAVIESLEDTNVETSLARNFVFTSNHDVLYREGMLSNPDDYGHPSELFQWTENATLVPIYPKWLMEEAEATYTYPDWPGPWD